MIEGFVGRPGSGKTYTMTKRALRRSRDYTAIVTNYPIDVRGRTKVRQIHDLSDLLGLTVDRPATDRLLVLLDEVHLWLPSRQSLRLPPSVMVKLSQTRKSGWDLWWSAQHQGRVDKALRDITNWLWYCTAWRLPFVDLPTDRPRWFVARSYEPEEFRKRGKHYTTVRVRFRKEVGQAYDTYGHINAAQHLGEVKDFYRDGGNGSKPSGGVQSSKRPGRFVE